MFLLLRFRRAAALPAELAGRRRQRELSAGGPGAGRKARPRDTAERNVGAADAAKLVKELAPDLDPYDLTLLPNRTFWIRPLVNGQSVEAFTAETISIEPRADAAPGAPGA